MADLLLQRARLFGADALVDVQIDDGVVTGLSSGIAAGSAEVVDCDGRLLLPGLWDEHVHMTQAAVLGQALPLGATGAAAEVLAAVRGALAEGGVRTRDMGGTAGTAEFTRALLDRVGKN